MGRPAVRVVAAYRKFPPAIALHRTFGHDFWIDAIGMLAASVARAGGREFRVLTDAEQYLPFDVLRCPTTETRHMLWAIEVCAHYLESDAFDQDTVALDCDVLVFADLAPLCAGTFDLGVVARRTPKGGQQILNGLQVWPLRARDRLAEFYWRALDVARGLSEDDLGWGADTEALCRLLAPVAPGRTQRRAGLDVRFYTEAESLASFSEAHLAALRRRRVHPVATPAVDFRNARKHHMRAFYEATRT